jgi:hypothetical protein
VADHRDPFGIDVLAIRQQLDRRADVVGVVGERRRFGASAALADAALVVADDDVAGGGERIGDLAEDRNAGDETVAIGRPAAPDSTTGGSRGALVCRGRDSVPASEKPLLGMLRGASFGREMTTLRDETAAISSRATSSACCGTLNRIIRPASSVQSSASRRPPGSTSAIRVRRALIRRPVVWICSADDSPTVMAIDS